MVRLVYLETYGCTLNQSDSDIIKKSLESTKYAVTADYSSADAVVINTCTVKGATENKIIERIKFFSKKKKPIVVAGCMSVNERLIRKIAPCASIVGTSSISNVAQAIEDTIRGQSGIYKSREDKECIARPFSAPILKVPICEGCTSNCHFCQTKLARPFLFSYAPKTILKFIEDGVKEGAREIQLTAMDTGVYGMSRMKSLSMFRNAYAVPDMSRIAGSILEHAHERIAVHDIDKWANGTDLVQLLEHVCGLEGKFFVRLGMINPQHAKRFGERLLNAFAHKRMYKFLHLPVQTGSERVCEEMNRQHTVADFIDIVESARKKMPDITISTDIIVGYPTERNEDFEQTLALMELVRPDIINISKFSPREGTVAKKMKQLPTQMLAKRSRELTALAKEIALRKNKKFVGKTYSILVTEKQKSYTGRNINYKQVVLRDFEGSLGDVVEVKIDDANHGSLFGRAVYSN